MILRLNLIVALVSLVAAIILYKVLTKKVQAKGIKAQLTTKAVIQKLAPSMTLNAKSNKISIKKNTLNIPPTICDSKLVTDQAPALLAVGYTILGKGNGSWYYRFLSMVKFDQIFLPFAIIICLLGMIAKTLPIHIALSGILGAVTLNCLNNFYLTWINHLAMNLALDRLSKVKLYSKSEHHDKTMDYLRSYAFRQLVPNSLKWML